MENTSKVRDFTRGGQITMHAIRMFGQASKYIILLTGFCFVLLFVLFATLKTTSYDRYVLCQVIEAEIKIGIHDDKAIHQIKTPNGYVVELPATRFVAHPNTTLSIKRCFHGFTVALWLSFILSLLMLMGLVYFFHLRGLSQRSMTKVRGGGITDAKTLKKMLIKADKASDIIIAGVPLLKGAETQHILLAGTTGTGKSVCMQELMDTVRAKKQRAIVYDIEGTFIPTYYRPGIDVILNPLDTRCPAWNIWQDCEDAADFEAIASSLMPLHLAGSDPFWIHSARTIFSAAALKLHRENKRFNQALLQPMFTESLGGLSYLLSGSVAESLVSDKNEKTALSIKATLSTYCKSLMYLKEDTAESLFSIRRWITEDKDDGWLFIASNALKVEALKPLISVWLDVAAKSILSLTPSLNRRLWFFMDELASLHRLPSLTATLSRSRKYGGCFVSAIQDIHQLRSIYGRDEAETLLALFNTNLCYRTKSPDSAAWMSKIMGGREIVEKKEGYSYGANDIRDGVSIHQERRKDAVIMDTEFLELDDLNAYLRLPGELPVTKVTFEIKNRMMDQPALIPRELSKGLILENSFETQPADEEESDKVLIDKSKILSGIKKIKRLDKKEVERA